MGLSGLLGNTFRLPAQQTQPAVPEQGAPNFGSPATGLQNVEGMTKGYYSKWGDLQSFAEEMNSMGIDVTKPDWRSAEAMEAHNLYKKAMADLQFQGNRLQESQKMMTLFARGKLSAHGADLGYGGAADAPFDANQIENTGMTSQAKSAATDARTEATIASADERTAATIESADVRSAAQIKSREGIATARNNLDRELATYRSAKTAKAFEEKMAPYANMNNELINAASGNLEWKPSTLLSPTGVPMMEAEFWGGEQVGTYETEIPDARGNMVIKTHPRAVRGVLQDTETNEVFIEYENGERKKLDKYSIPQIQAARAENAVGLKAADSRAFSEIAGQEDIKTEPVSEFNLSQAKSVAKRIKDDTATFDDLNKMGGGIDLTIDGIPINIHKESNLWHGVWGGSSLRVENGKDLGFEEDKQYSGAQVAEKLHSRGHYIQKTEPQDKARAIQPKKPVKVYDPVTKTFITPADSAQSPTAPVIEQAAPAQETPIQVPIQEAPIQEAPIQEAPVVEQAGIAVSDWRDTKAKKERQKWEADDSGTELVAEIERVSDKTKMEYNLTVESMLAYMELNDPDETFEDWFTRGGYKVGQERLEAQQ